jgi:hypothetical protein
MPSSADLAQEFGISANKIGRLANAYGLKISNYGEYRLSKSTNGAKQVEQFYYNEAGRREIAMALEHKMLIKDIRSARSTTAHGSVHEK